HVQGGVLGPVQEAAEPAVGDDRRPVAGDVDAGDAAARGAREGVQNVDHFAQGQMARVPVHRCLGGKHYVLVDGDVKRVAAQLGGERGEKTAEAARRGIDL